MPAAVEWDVVETWVPAEAVWRAARDASRQLRFLAARV
jgi:hypothetical protein